MKVALNWLREYCRWDWPIEELVRKLTMSGTEVEAVHTTGFDRDLVVTAKILSFTKHPNADRLSVCQVDDGSGHARQIVCGARNFKEGDIVPLALPGAEMPGGFKIKDSKLRGEKSSGMMCSGGELGLPDDADGLMILPAGTPVGKPIRELFNGDTVLELEVTPNRPDLLSYRGLARELAALGAEPLGTPLPSPDPAAAGGAWKVDVRDPGACPRYTARLIEGVRVGASPAWLRERLEAAGLRPVNAVVDVTDYVLFELGQPLHAFDADKLDGPAIVVRRAAEGEKLAALNGKEYTLDAQDLVIADAKGPVALAGVMGGEPTGVTGGTTRILLESARFQPSLVRRTSRRLALISDSSYRFERGIDPALVDAAMQRAVALITELCGGAASGPAVESAPFVPVERSVPLGPEAVARVMGRPVEDARVAKILSSLGLKDEGGSWGIPGYRADLEREIDLVEEVARIEGLESVESKIAPGVAPRGPVDAHYERLGRLRRLLAAWGYHEMLTGSLVPRSVGGEGSLRVLNPLNEDNVWLRASLLETLLPCVRQNLARGVENVKAFEAGTVWSMGKKGHEEALHLAIVATGLERGPHWSERERAYDYFSLKGVLEALAGEFSEVRVPENFGPVSPALLKQHGIKAQVWAVELTLPRLADPRPASYRPLPAHPAMKRDLCFVVDRKIGQADLAAAIGKAGVAELEDFRCFDLFEDPKGEKLAAGKKALAYALTYRSPERTLTEKDVAAWEEKIIRTVGAETGAVLR